MNNKISRRNFFRYISWLMAIPFAILAGHSIHRHNLITRKREVRMPANPVNEITFQKDVIIVKKEDSFKIYSARCPHLGCRIISAEDGQLVCPCHGSRFDLEGKNLKGPAANPLKKLEFTLDELNGEIIIRV